MLRPSASAFLGYLRSMTTRSKGLERMLEGNRAWVQGKTEKDADFFARLAREPQKPTYLYIGCADSRVPANNVTGLDAGDLFVHRNIANMVVNTDLNLLSVLQFSVEALKVNHVVVCGHYGCGGVEAALGNAKLDILESWLSNIRDVHRLHQDEMDGIHDKKEKLRRLVELNVMEQCRNLAKNHIIQKEQEKRSGPHIHGMVYDLATGLLKELDWDSDGFAHSLDKTYKLKG